MNKNKFNLIAETAFSHEGDSDYLFQQIDAAKAGGADIVKFQILTDIDAYYSPSHRACEVVKNWMLAKNTWEEAINYAYAINLEVLVLPLEIETVNFIESKNLPVQYYEIHSVNFLELPLLDILRTTSKNIILGIGGRTSDEIRYVIEYLGRTDIELMFGFQSFPTEAKDLNMRKIASFIAEFKVPVGYADHTSFLSDHFHRLNEIAFLLGARLFEKHIVIKKGEKRIDYESGIDKNDFVDMRSRLTELVDILGDGDTSIINKRESTYRNREKTALYGSNLQRNHILQHKDIIYRQYDQNLSIKQFDVLKFIGKALKINVQQNKPVLPDDFQ